MRLKYFKQETKETVFVMGLKDESIYNDDDRRIAAAFR